MGLFGHRNLGEMDPGMFLPEDSELKARERAKEEKELLRKDLLQIQIINKDKKIILEASKKAGLSLSAFIRMISLRESKIILEEK